MAVVQHGAQNRFLSLTQEGVGCLFCMPDFRHECSQRNMLFIQTRGEGEGGEGGQTFKKCGLRSPRIQNLLSTKTTGDQFLSCIAKLYDWLHRRDFVTPTIGRPSLGRTHTIKGRLSQR